MPKLYLLGGENVYRQSAREVNELALQDAGQPPSIAVFPWARASFDRNYRKRKLLADYLVGMGAGNVDFIEYSDSQDTITKKVSASNLVYLTGGLVNALTERLKNTNVVSLLRDYHGVVVGRSAGALALCKKCVITCHSNQKVKLVNGLGIADITLKAHYKLAKDEALKLLSQKEKIYCLPSRSAIIYDKGVCEIIGPAYVFENGEKKTLYSRS